MNRTRVYQGLAFAALAVAWGLNYPFVRLGLEYSSGLWLAFFRAGVGLAGVSVLMLFLPSGGTLDRAGKRDAMLLGLVNTGLFFGLWFEGASHVAPGETSVVIYTFPLWVSLLSAPLLHRRLRNLEWVSVVAGFSGILLVTQVWTLFGPGVDGFALLEILGGAVCWALATVLFKRRFRAGTFWTANAYQLAGGSGGLLVAAVALQPGGYGSPAPQLIEVVLYMGLIGTTLAYVLWFALLERLHASTLSNFTFAVPVVALAASAAIFGEGLTVFQALGVVLVSAGIFLTGRDVVADAPPPPRGD